VQGGGHDGRPATSWPDPLGPALRRYQERLLVQPPRDVHPNRGPCRRGRVPYELADMVVRGRRSGPDDARLSCGVSATPVDPDGSVELASTNHEEVARPIGAQHLDRHPGPLGSSTWSRGLGVRFEFFALVGLLQGSVSRLASLQLILLMGRLVESLYTLLPVFCTRFRLDLRPSSLVLCGSNRLQIVCETIMIVRWPTILSPPSMSRMKIR
jgi:hypothetical protein